LSRQQDDDTGWRRFLYPARRARNIVTTVPLPFNSAAVRLPDLMGQLDALLPMLRIYAGEEAVRLGQEAVETGTELASFDHSPLLNMVLDLASDTAVQSNGLLLPLTDFLSNVRDHLKWRLGAQQTSVHALTWHNLSESKLFDRLIVIGPLYWYQDHQFVFTSP